MLYIAKKRGLRLLEVPVVWNDSEGSTVNYASDSIKMFVDLLRIRLNDIAGRYDDNHPDAAVAARKSTTSAGS